MAYVKKLFNDNFLYYASYVIKDRAIPDIDDGLKPVQRRILHSLFEIDDGKFHKVANVVGHCMKYHPHGDQSIYSALVVLANKELFIDKQGNFGNLYTGDEASAARYIECRATPLAKDIFYNPKTTAYEESYDGRNKEPTVFPAKVPVLLMIGAEGIAVGMSTKILPHNPVEVLKAEIACLQGKRFSLHPDFPTGGVADVSEYQDGMGKIRVRAKFDLSDPKRIVIRELPFGSTTESLIASVEAAAKAGRLKIASISDFTTEKVEIEIRLQRGVYADEVVDALYAFTECEQSISCNFLVIKDGQPVQMTATEAVRRHAEKLVGVLKAELKIEEGELLDELHARTLERIFIEERVYKAIETKKTQEAVSKAVLDGLLPFKKEIRRDVTLEDVERLLKIPIRRISLYDIERAKAEMDRIKARLKEVRAHLADLVGYAVGWLEGLKRRLEPGWARRTELAGFARVDAKEVARRDIALRYDAQAGYLGTAVSTGDSILQVSPYDKILVVRRSGIWSVVPLPERLFVDQGMLFCAIAEKEALADLVFSLVYRDAERGFPHIKRFRIEGWIMNKDYQLLPDGAQALWFTASPSSPFVVSYVPKARQKVQEERFRIEDFEPKGIKAGGVRLAPKEVLSVRGPELPSGAGTRAGTEAPGLFDTAAAERPAKAASAAGKQAAATKPSSKSGAKTAAKPASRADAAAKPSAKAAAKAASKPAKEAKTAKGGLLAAAEARKAASGKESPAPKKDAAAAKKAAGKAAPAAKRGEGKAPKVSASKGKKSGK